MINRALIRLWNSDLPADPLLQVHDSILFQTSPDNELEVVKRISKELDCPITLNGKTFKIGLEFAKGKSWYDLEEVEYDV